MTWARQNRLFVAATVALLVWGATLYDATDPAKVWFWLACLVVQASTAWLDQRRTIRDIRAGRDRAYPAERP